MMMQKIEVKDGKVANILEVDPINIPEWCDGWPDYVAGVKIGWVYSAGKFSPDLEKLAEDARAQRDMILKNVVDPLVSNNLRWAELTTGEQAAWVTYRRALLDVPQQAKFPETIVWPSAPEV
jgi:hypothetical protein